jgi:predicted nucleotidyltransferase
MGVRNKRQQTYYQAAADGYLIAGTMAILHRRITAPRKQDANDLALIARIYQRIIERGPERYHHVVEQSPDVRAIAKQLLGED